MIIEEFCSKINNYYKFNFGVLTSPQYLSRLFLSLGTYKSLSVYRPFRTFYKNETRPKGTQ